jgi:hypothetical protein
MGLYRRDILDVVFFGGVVILPVKKGRRQKTEGRREKRAEG